MFWIIVMLEDSSTTPFQCSHWGKEVVTQSFPVHGPTHPPLDTVKSSCPLSWETPPKHNVSTSMLHSGSSLGLYSAFLFLQTRRVELMPNSSILVSSDHIAFSQASSGSSRCSLANFRRACTCAFFSRGTLQKILILTDGSLHDCGPNCLQVINKLLLCSTGLIPDLSHHRWYPTRWNLVWSPRPREIGSDFVPFSNNCSNSC